MTSPVIVIYETSLAGVQHSKLFENQETPQFCGTEMESLILRLHAIGYSLRRLS